MTRRPDPRTVPNPLAAASAAWLALQYADVHGAVSFSLKPDSRTTVVVGCWDAPAVARVARALDAAGYDVHTPTGRPTVVEAQHYAHAAAELTAEAEAAELAGDAERAECKHRSAALALQLLDHAAAAWTAAA